MANNTSVTEEIQVRAGLFERQQRENDKLARSSAIPSPSQSQPILSAEAFCHLLTAERKRTDRTGIPFVVALIQIKKNEQKKRFPLLSSVSSVSESFYHKLHEAVSASCREVDIKGWYKNRRVMGVVFINCNETVKPLIKEKISKSIEEKLTVPENSHVTVECFCYPEDNYKEPEDDSSVRENVFYPELELQPLSRRLSIFCIDFIGSLMCIAIFSPVFILVALVIKLTSEGPTIFAQQRVGLGGKKFTVYKFRSMYVDNDDSIHRKYIDSFIKNNDAYSTDGETKIFKIQNDPRITPVGRFLRKTSLDELPQFFNVLWGNMSLVGPRPTLPYEVAIYKKWHLARVLETKPGITGFWQVEGRSFTNFDEMVRMDLRYIKARSLWWDIKLILKTPFVMTSTHGAY